MAKAKTPKPGKTWFRFLRRSRYHSRRLLIFAACREDRVREFLDLLSTGGEAPVFDYVGKYDLQHPQLEKRFLLSESITKLSFLNFFPVLVKLLARRYDTAVLIAGKGNWKESRNLLTLSAILPAKNILIVGKRFSLFPLTAGQRLRAAFSFLSGFIRNSYYVALLFLAFIALPVAAFLRRYQRAPSSGRKAVGYLVKKTRLNPYLILLTEALEKAGSPTTADVPLHFRWLWKNRDEFAALHFQWINAHFPAEDFWEQFREVTCFLWYLVTARVLGYRLVTTHHNLWPHEVRHRALFYLASFFTLQACDGVIVHTESGIRELQRLYFFDIKRIHYLPHPAYSGWYSNIISRQEARRKLNLPPEAFCYLFFGMIREYKGIDVFLEAIGETRDKDVFFLIAGEPAQALVASEILEASLRDSRIRIFLRYIPEDEVQVFFNAADVAVLPYREIFGSGSLLLALTFGKPVIVSNLFGCRDLITQDEGILVEPGNGRALAVAMKDIRQKKLGEMSKAAFALAERCNIWQDYAKKIREIIHAV